MIMVVSFRVVEPEFFVRDRPSGLTPDRSTDTIILNKFSGGRRAGPKIPKPGIIGTQHKPLCFFLSPEAGRLLMTAQAIWVCFDRKQPLGRYPDSEALAPA
jgi:hypothetical protein